MRPSLLRSATRTLPLALGLIAASLPAAAQEFVRIDDFRAGASNGAGSIIAGEWSTTDADGNPTTLAARWDRGTLRALQGIPIGVEFRPVEVDDAGRVFVGDDFVTSGAPRPALLLVDEEFSRGPDELEVWQNSALSTDGEMLGARLRPAEGGSRPAVLALETNTLTELPCPESFCNGWVDDVNADGSVRVGKILFSNGLGTVHRAARWDGTALSLAPISETDADGYGTEYGIAEAVAVTPNGAVVLGWNQRLTGLRGPGGQLWYRVEMWLWEGNALTQLPPFPGYDHTEEHSNSQYWQPIDVSADGRTVLARCGIPRPGEPYNTDNVPCLWDAEAGWRVLPDLIAETGVDVDSLFFTTHSSSAPMLTADGRTVIGVARQRSTGEWFSYRFGAPLESPLTVNDTGDQPDAELNDGVCDADLGESGLQCTLRAAIELANAIAGRDSISVDIDGDGPHTITLTSPLPALTGPIVLDATTQPGYDVTPLLVVNGGGLAGDGFVLDQGESTLRGLAIGGFQGAGVRITGPGENRVEACYTGVRADGTTALPNGVGVLIEGSPDNVIGGTEPEQRNLISGNSGPGVVVTGAGASGNVVAGNHIGTDAAGTFPVPNGAEGVLVEDAPGVMVGGDIPEARNVISGNAAHGVAVQGPDAAGVEVLGNYIGVAADGTTPLGNGTDDAGPSGHHGVLVASAPDVQIGGATGTPGAAPGNVIAANAAHGVLVTGRIDEPGPADGARVLGNLIGTDAAGTSALPNGAEAVYLDGAVRNARIGQAGAGNVIVSGAEGSPQSGIYLFDLGEAAGAPDGAVVAANTIGLNATGSAALGNPATGIAALSERDDRGVEGLTIGGEDAASGNRIRAALGIFVSGPRSSGAAIAFNTVGLLANGQLAGDERDALGIFILLADEISLASNTVGGQTIGVILAGNGATIVGNRIGTNPAGNAARPNGLGLYVPGEITAGVVGGPSVPVGDGNQIGAQGEANVISGNEFNGIRLGGDFSLPDAPALTASSAPGADSRPALTAALSVRALGVEAVQTATRRVIARVEEGSLGRARATAPPDGEAQALNDEVGPDGNTIAFNLVGTDVGGTRELGNGRNADADQAGSGMWISDGRGNQLLGNLVSGNGVGVLIAFDPEYVGSPRESVLAGNLIGSSRATGSAAAIPNQYGGVAIIGSADNRLGALPLEDGGEPVGNVVAHNGERGVLIRPIDGEDVGNQVRATVFDRNGGPSIQLFDVDLEYPALAPAPPSLYQAVVAEGGARILFRAGITGEVDLFTSATCEGGHADGTPIGMLEGQSTTITANVPLEVSGSLTDIFLALTVTPNAETGTTSAFSECVRIAYQEDAAEAEVEAGETGVVLDEVGIEVDVTENAETTAPARVWAGSAQADGMQAGGTLYATRYGVPPVRSPFSGSATAPDGKTVTPNVTSTHRSWTLRADGLSGITYSACLDITGLEGVEVPGQLVVVHRASAREPWTAYASTLAGGGTKLCASGLTAFGDLGVGGDMETNPVPVDPVAKIPSAFGLSEAFPNPARSRATLTLAMPAAGDVRVEVFNMLGQRVSLLHGGPLAAGEHSLALDASELAPGLYVVRAATSEGVLSRSIVVMR